MDNMYLKVVLLDYRLMVIALCASKSVNTGNNHNPRCQCYEWIRPHQYDVI